MSTGFRSLSTGALSALELRDLNPVDTSGRHLTIKYTDKPAVYHVSVGLASTYPNKPCLLFSAFFPTKIPQGYGTGY